MQEIRSLAKTAKYVVKFDANLPVGVPSSWNSMQRVFGAFLRNFSHVVFARFAGSSDIFGRPQIMVNGGADSTRVKVVGGTERERRGVFLI